MGVGVVGDLNDKRSTGAPTVIDNHTTEACGKRRKRQFRRKRRESMLPMRAPGPHHSRLHSLQTNEGSTKQSSQRHSINRHCRRSIFHLTTLVRLDAFWYKVGLLYVNGLRVVIGQVLGVVESQ